MSDIAQLEGRITAALDRIRRGLDRVGGAPVAPAGADTGPAALAALNARLEEERTANAQLEERVKVLKERQDGKLTGMEAEIARQRGRLADLDGDLQKLRQSNAELREIAGQMRAALADNLAEPELVNRAVIAELDALRATRDADRAEVEAVLAELRPIIEEAG